MESLGVRKGRDEPDQTSRRVGGWMDVIDGMRRCAVEVGVGISTVAVDIGQVARSSRW